MRVLIGCERSGVIRDEFRKRGHEAWSCDLLGPSDDPEGFKIQQFPNYHLEGDVRWFLRPENAPNGKPWNLFIVHPDCRRLCVSGNAHHANTHGRFKDLLIVQELLDVDIERVCLENPVGVISSAIRKPDQYIQPYEFGDDASKKTGLWLRNLPKLIADASLYVEPRWVEYGGKLRPRWANQTDSGQNRLGPSETRSQERARTYKGIAIAMAEQWGQL